MAAVQPHAAPSRQPPPAAAVPAPSQAAQPPCKRGRADAVHGVAHGRSRQERVAKSCCASEREQELELVLVDDDNSGDEDGGCGSFVGDGGGAQDDEDEVEGRGSVVVRWHHQESNCSLWANGRSRAAGGELRAGDEDEDPKVAVARRQEEDRKFWEACLASGYP